MDKQQNQMSVQVKEKKDGCHDSHFYRANPYISQGYIPTPSLRNRKQPEFTTQIPQGIDYFEPSARKHFTDIDKKSQITQMHLFQTPERFPMENRLAIELEYDRNLNTIDIEGASANSKKNKAIRNRIKAQEDLLRRKAPILTPLLAVGVSEQQRRRKLAQEQLDRLNSRQSQKKSNAYRKHQSQRKLAPVQHYIRSPYIEMRDQEVEVDMTALQKQLKKRGRQEQQPLMYTNPEMITYDSKAKNPEERSKRYEQDQNISQSKESLIKPSSDYNIHFYDNGSSSSRLQSGSAGSSAFNEQMQQYFDKQRKNIEKDFLRKQMRQINPTNLSYEGSFVRNSSIFANLGKKLAMK